MKDAPLFSVIIPVFRCAPCLAELAARLEASLSPLSKDYEVLLVDDGSPDDAWAQIKALAARDPRIKGLALSRNFGQHYAISAGLEHARGQWVVIMDGDLQDRPEEVPKLHRKALEGYDVVYAISDFRGSRAFLANMVRRVYFRLYDFLSDSGTRSTNLSFCLLSARAKDSVVNLKEYSRHISSLVRFVGFPIAGVVVEHDERKQGKSAYTLTKRAVLAYDGIIAYSSRLLKMSFVMGLAFSCGAFLFAAFLIVGRLRGHVWLPGWTSVMVLISFATGMILMSVGIVGMYLEKVYLEVKNLPLFILKETVNLDR